MRRQEGGRGSKKTGTGDRVERGYERDNKRKRGKEEEARSKRNG